MRTFILADNQDITREGLLSLFDKTAFADRVSTATNRAELKEQLIKYPEAAVILDYTLFDFSESGMLNMKSRFHDSLWLLFSDELSKHFMRQILFSGEQFGIVMKTDPREDIVTALKYAASDEAFLCDLARQILEEDVPVTGAHDNLTASERHILREIALGKTTKEIAFEQNLSFHTINTHRKNIFRKLEVNNVHDAIRHAIRAGIIDAAEYYI
ncbi:MAG: response regulator transcription factor [Prevotellaceae bacterium]|jgi:DNA-binding NarL/FixJ family response regulator|nr:response regulator transcription factor [Prevotellaceae bacterium]